MYGLHRIGWHVYELNEPLDSHPKCRCGMLPATLDYKDLGLNVPDAEPLPTAGDWFQEQPEFRLPHHKKTQAIQSEMMGARKFAAYQEGKINLPDLVTVKTNRIWGKSATVKSNKALGV